MMEKLHSFCRGITFFLMALCATQCSAYSVLTHEEIIDLAWNSSIRPLLLAKFPGATEAQLLEAHAYAYGGSAVQDMGYYPFGKVFFSNLTHYVRAGDFVVWLLDNAKTIDEYAFAIGALSHYLGDSIGHSHAVNPATAIEFPKLERKYGKSVTYDESPHGHIRTEFAFDIEELRNQDFAPPSYLRFIGFKIPRKFLEQAFRSIYGFDVHELFGRSHPALRSYRTFVRSFIPAFAAAEVVLHRNQFPPPPDDEAYRTFATRVARTNYERKWKHLYYSPGIKAHLLAILVFLVPKIGPVSDLAIKIPTPETEEWYLQSVNLTVDEFRKKLSELAADPDPALTLANVDLDTGYAVRRGDYPLADQAYDQLIARLTSRRRPSIPESLRKDILAHYAGASIAEEDSKLNRQLSQLKSMPTR
jgi:hypothetical protein